MPLRNKLLLSLALPAAAAVIAVLLWTRRKKRDTDAKLTDPEERRKLNAKRKKTEERAMEQPAALAHPTQSERVAETLEQGDERFCKDVEAAAVESVEQDSGVVVQPMASSLNENESTSEGSVDSSSLLCISVSPTNASPPPDENGKLTKSSSHNGTAEKDVWELEFPQILCGRLIGRKGKNVKVISENSGAKIRLIPQAPGEVSTHRIISIVGTKSQIERALGAIHERFPTVPLKRLNQNKPCEPVLASSPSATAAAAAPFVQTVLPSVPSFEVVVTSVLDAGHFFLQLNSDILQQQLQDLHQNMLGCYGQGVSSVVLPMSQPIVVGSYCAAPAFTYDGWYRAQVLGPTGNPDEVEVKYLDYGGYGRISASSLRQLRADYLSLAFQAIECCLANVIPLQGEMFSSVAGAVMEDMTMNQVISARVVGHRNGLPCLELYLVQGQQTVMVNRELVTRGLARWVET